MERSGTEHPQRTRVLRSADGDVLHEVVYDDVDWPDVAGASLSLDPGAFTPASAADPTSWCAGQTAYDTGDLGTPGAANDSCP